MACISSALFLCQVTQKVILLKRKTIVLKDPTLGDYILTWDFKHEHLHDLLHNILDSEMSLYENDSVF